MTDRNPLDCICEFEHCSCTYCHSNVASNGAVPESSRLYPAKQEKEKNMRGDTWVTAKMPRPPQGIVLMGYAYHDPSGTVYVGTLDEILEIIPEWELVWRLTGIGKKQMEVLCPVNP